MIIKRYLVSNMNEALTRIRHELGRDAVIIAQRKVRKPGVRGFFQGKLIEVTAAVENGKKEEEKERKIQEDSFQSSLEALKKVMDIESGDKRKEDTIVEKEKNIKKSLEKDGEVPSLEKEVLEMKALLNKVIKNTEREEKKDELLDLLNSYDIDFEFYDELKKQIENIDNPKEELQEIIKNSLQVSNLDLKGRVVLVGPTGVGKTTTIAKLAGRLSLVEKKKVGLITIDTYRIGAVEQLKTYAEIMDIKFKVVITMKEMEEAVEELKDCDVILIDTTGRSSKNSMQISELRAFVQKANADFCNLVISATTKTRDIKTIIDGYKELQFKNIIITKLDETSTYGSLYNISKRAEKPISFITIGQGVPEDIKIPTKEELSKLIFQEGEVC